MGTTAEKGAYIIETKSLLKDKINNLGGSIDDNTTFRNYANQLQNVYDNLPKTEYQEGTEINLGITSKGKLDYEDNIVGYGQTEQDSTTGNNLVGLTTTQCPVSLSAGDKIVARNTSNIAFTLQLFTNYGDETRNDYWTISSGSTRVITVGYDTGALSWNGNITDGVAWVNLGETIQDYEPYTGGQASPNPSYPQTINSVTGNQDVVVRGKNEINVPEIVVSARSYIYRANIGSGNYSISITKSRVDGVTIGNQYAYMYKEIKFYDSNDTLLSTNTGTSAPSITTSPVTKVFNFTAPQNTSYMEIEFSNNNGDDNLNTLLSNVMLVSGTYNESTMPDYEPYITPTSYQLSLGDIELNAIGNYKDELIYDVDEDKVYKKSYIGETEITSSSSITYEASLTNVSRFSVVIENVENAVNSGEAYCNCFTLINGWALDSEHFYIYGTSSTKKMYFFIDNGTASSLAELQTWLANKTIKVVYVLITPTLTEITDTTLINQVKALYNAHSLNGTTIITSNGNLPMIIKCRALKGE